MKALLLAVLAFAACAPSQYHATVGRSHGEIESPNGRDWDTRSIYGELGATWDVHDRRALERPAPELEPDPLTDVYTRPAPSAEPWIDPELRPLLGLLGALVTAWGGVVARNRYVAHKQKGPDPQ